MVRDRKPRECINAWNGEVLDDRVPKSATALARIIKALTRR
jgi:hypothetical protein